MYIRHTTALMPPLSGCEIQKGSAWAYLASFGSVSHFAEECQEWAKGT